MHEGSDTQGATAASFVDQLRRHCRGVQAAGFRLSLRRAPLPNPAPSALPAPPCLPCPCLPLPSAEYAQVLRMLGNGRLEAHCMDGTKRLCHIRGKMRKKVWVNTGDIVLVGLRDYQDEKADVILK